MKTKFSKNYWGGLRQFEIPHSIVQDDVLKGKFDGMDESERNALFDACFDYDDHLRGNGHWGSGVRRHDIAL